MRISDWSSDVCSSDLRLAQHLEPPARRRPLLLERIAVGKVRIIAEMMRGRARDSADEPLRSSDLSHPHTLERLDALVDLIGNPAQIHGPLRRAETRPRSEEHTSELQSLMRISYAVFCLQKKKNKNK